MNSTKRFSPASRIIAAFCLIVCTFQVQAAVADITPDTLYAQALQVEKEVALMKRHFNVTATNPVAAVEADFKPHHIEPKAYEIQLKLNIFRHKHNITGFAPVILEPERRQGLLSTWGQIQRTLTEIRIVKTYLDIPGEATPVTAVQGKRLIDVFNKLNQIGHDMDTLNGKLINASYVYGEVRRLNEDVNDILRKTGTVDNAAPPAGNPNATPKEALQAAFELMDEIQRLQRQMGIETADFGVFRKTENVVSADVYNMVILSLAELQLIKAELGMKRAFTPPAQYQEAKMPAEVEQLLGYVGNKLRLIKLGERR